MNKEMDNKKNWPAIMKNHVGLGMYGLIAATFLVLLSPGCGKKVDKPSSPNPPNPPEVVIRDTATTFSLKKLSPVIPVSGNPAKDSVYYTVLDKEHKITNKKTGAVLETKRFGIQDTLMTSFSSPSGVIYHLAGSAAAGKVSVTHHFESKGETVTANVLWGVGLSMKDGTYKELDAKTGVTATKTGNTYSFTLNVDAALLSNAKGINAQCSYTDKQGKVFKTMVVSTRF